MNKSRYCSLTSGISSPLLSLLLRRCVDLSDKHLGQFLESKPDFAVVHLNQLGLVDWLSAERRRDVGNQKVFVRVEVFGYCCAR